MGVRTKPPKVKLPGFVVSPWLLVPGPLWITSSVTLWASQPAWNW